jgi:hypothetical protein
MIPMMTKTNEAQGVIGQEPVDRVLVVPGGEDGEVARLDAPG